MSDDLMHSVWHIGHNQIQVYLLGVTLRIKRMFDEHHVGMWRQQQVDLEFSVVVSRVLEHFLDCDLFIIMSSALED